MNLAEMAGFFRAIGVGREKGDTHDYTVRVPGHDFTFRPRDGGLKGHMMGWGYGLKRGHYLVLPHDEAGTTRYRIESISYYSDPPDMWSAEVVFAPRPMK